jgi:hypothetical protein
MPVLKFAVGDRRRRKAACTRGGPSRAHHRLVFLDDIYADSPRAYRFIVVDTSNCQPVSLAPADNE